MPRQFVDLSALIALYGLAVSFVFIRVVGVGTLTAISHDVILNDGGAGWGVVAACWIFMAILVARVAFHFVKHGAPMDLAVYGTPTSRLLWSGLTLLVGAFFLARHGEVSGAILHAWSVFFVLSLVYIAAADLRGARYRIMDRLLGMPPLRHSPRILDDTLQPPSQPLAPEEAMPQSVAHTPLPVIVATFARIMSHFGHQLPEEDVIHRRRGRIGDPEDGDYGYGDTVYYLFGQDEQGEYLDFYMAHRIAGDTHGRIREDGRYESLDVVSPFGPVVSDDPEEYARNQAEDQAEVSRIHALLAAKGFPSSY